MDVASAESLKSALQAYVICCWNILSRKQAKAWQKRSLSGIYSSWPEDDMQFPTNILFSYCFSFGFTSEFRTDILKSIGGLNEKMDIIKKKQKILRVF